MCASLAADQPRAPRAEEVNTIALRARETVPAKTSPGRESTVTLTRSPARTEPESTSSIGALTKIEVGSIRSTTGGEVSSGGEGVTHSPSSTFTSRAW